MPNSISTQPTLPKLKILLVHNSYQHFGGEDAVLAAETVLLRDYGHDVRVEVISNNSITGIFDKLRIFIDAPYSAKMKLILKHWISEFQPHIVHFHNFFPMISPSAHEAASEAGIPVIQTLHNYRLMCANALLMRDGNICELCVSGGAARIHGIIHKCYRGSALSTLGVTRMQWRAERMDTWNTHVSKFIALTNFSKDKFVSMGIKSDKIVIKPNYLSAQKVPEGIDRHHVIYVGRLVPEKGVGTLVDAMRALPDVRLIVVGEGPLRSMLEQDAPENVTFLGALSAAEVRDLMKAAVAVVCPSIWYEGFPMVVVEAFAASTPVIASRIGSLGEVVSHDVTGLLFPPGDAAALAACILKITSSPNYSRALGENAWNTYDKNFTPQKAIMALNSVYESVL